MLCKPLYAYISNADSNQFSVKMKIFFGAFFAAAFATSGGGNALWNILSMVYDLGHLVVRVSNLNEVINDNNALKRDVILCIIGVIVAALVGSFASDDEDRRRLSGDDNTPVPFPTRAPTPAPTLPPTNATHHNDDDFSFDIDTNVAQTSATIFTALQCVFCFISSCIILYDNQKK